MSQKEDFGAIYDNYNEASDKERDGESQQQEELQDVLEIEEEEDEDGEDDTQCNI